MTALATAPKPEEAAPAKVPPLESGMRLSSEEFERRYLLHPEIWRAELIQGVVYVASPMRHELHGQPGMLMSGWLSAYIAAVGHERVDGGQSSTVRLSFGNNVQPDAFLRLRDGTSLNTPDGYLSGAPELVVEVAASSASIDLGAKKEAYRAAGVREYLVWQQYENRFDWLWLNEAGEFESLVPDAAGVIESRTFPGLRLEVAALLRKDFAAVLGVPSSRERKRRVRRAPGR